MDRSTNAAWLVNPRLASMASSGLREIGLEVAPAPLDRAARPAGHAQNVLRRHAPLLAVVIAELDGVGAVLVDDDDDVQTAAAGPERSGGEHCGQIDNSPVRNRITERFTNFPAE